MRFLISAGEASSEAYGAQLIAALRRRLPQAEFFGVGGERMRAAGCDIIVDARHISVVGITEILTRLPRIYWEFRKLLRALDRRRPDAGVVIDSPAFNFRVARQLHRRGVPVIYFVAPQLWAWREGRVRLVRKFIRKALVIFPFEEEFYRRHKVDAEYVGHPLASQPAAAEKREDFARRYRLDPTQEWLALLPGSRRKEVRMNLPAMLSGAGEFAGQYALILPVASTLEKTWIAGRLPASPRVTLVDEARAALSFARAAVVASGTATVEAALAGTPFVVVYRVSPLSWLLGRPLVKVPHFAMVNLIAGKGVVPELIQSEFTAANLAARLRQILDDGPPRQVMLTELKAVAARLQPAGSGETPADRAADAILRLL